MVFISADYDDMFDIYRVLVGALFFFHPNWLIVVVKTNGFVLNIRKTVKQCQIPRFDMCIMSRHRKYSAHAYGCSFYALLFGCCLWITDEHRWKPFQGRNLISTALTNAHWALWYGKVGYRKWAASQNSLPISGLCFVCKECLVLQHVVVLKVTFEKSPSIWELHF